MFYYKRQNKKEKVMTEATDKRLSSLRHRMVPGNLSRDVQKQAETGIDGPTSMDGLISRREITRLFMNEARHVLSPPLVRVCFTALIGKYLFPDINAKNAPNAYVYIDRDLRRTRWHIPLHPMGMQSVLSTISADGIGRVDDVITAYMKRYILTRDKNIDQSAVKDDKLKKLLSEDVLNLETSEVQRKIYGSETVYKAFMLRDLKQNYMFTNDTLRNLPVSNIKAMLLLTKLELFLGGFDMELVHEHDVAEFVKHMGDSTKVYPRRDSEDKNFDKDHAYRARVATTVARAIADTVLDVHSANATNPTRPLVRVSELGWRDVTPEAACQSPLARKVTVYPVDPEFPTAEFQLVCNSNQNLAQVYFGTDSDCCDLPGLKGIKGRCRMLICEAFETTLADISPDRLNRQLALLMVPQLAVALHALNRKGFRHRNVCRKSIKVRFLRYSINMADAVAPLKGEPILPDKNMTTEDTEAISKHEETLKRKNFSDNTVGSMLNTPLWCSFIADQTGAENLVVQAVLGDYGDVQYSGHQAQGCQVGDDLAALLLTFTDMFGYDFLKEYTKLPQVDDKALNETLKAAIVILDKLTAELTANDTEWNKDGVSEDEYPGFKMTQDDLRFRVKNAKRAVAKARDATKPQYSSQELFPVWDARGEVEVADRFLGMLRRSSEVGDAQNENLIRKELTRNPKLRIFTDHGFMLNILFPFLIFNIIIKNDDSSMEYVWNHFQHSIRPLTWSCAAGLGGAEDDGQDPLMFIGNKVNHAATYTTKKHTEWQRRIQER